MQELGTITPTLEEFREFAASRRVVPVRMSVLADALTPVGLYRALVTRDGAARPGTFLLESAAEGGVWSRYSFVGAGSVATLTAQDGRTHWIGDAPSGAPTDGDPLEALRATMELLHTEPFEGVPPLTSGMVGFVGWEAVRRWEKLPHPPEDDLHVPELAMNLVSDMAVHDSKDGTVLLVANAVNVNGTDENVDAAYHDAVARLESMLRRLATPLERTTVSVAPPGPVDLEAAVEQSWDRELFMSAIDRGKQAIVDGEIFQVVVSRRFETECGADSLDVYRTLRRINPSPYMYLYSFEDAHGRPYSIVGSSPEALVTVTGRQAVTHPIAGSRPRGATVDEDLALGEDLLADEKERAEHLMLVDLARNDLSRVAEPGSVDVSEFMEIERFSHIMHLCSTVVARMREDVTAYDVLAATFPAGTLSGAPKPRALQLLDEYEPLRRAVYGGVVGYMDFAGNMDMAIAIRTALLLEGRAYVQAGGGIVADSDPESEAQESLNKATAPLRAALIAQSLRPLAP
ncbi:anthranilate synthase component I [Kocuria rhizophila]|uniref:anthranilate synthase component I n=1 Tax=Kocuria rhizophila TaxID=72000 RepID=UPI001ABE2E33|nr:anthranilate synthase component I [Kocuria rhizophila]MBO4144405.1 anthranilate synthase component I [Kocuria rhizophila]MDN3225649.1 anthranilate synthase component I [Kocuria rhizophila]QTK32561.1 anthranilate synthase component I [Kocuria rhizophila]